MTNFAKCCLSIEEGPCAIFSDRSDQDLELQILMQIIGVHIDKWDEWTQVILHVTLVVLCFSV